MWANRVVLYLPSFAIWDGCCKAAKAGTVIAFLQRDFPTDFIIIVREGVIADMPEKQENWLDKERDK